MDSPWSAGITGAAGILGVLVGLWGQTQLAPRTEERLRANTRTVLRVSLWAELTSLAKLMQEEIDHIEHNNFTWIPLVESFKVYVANIENLGLLTPTEAQKITIAYYQYQESAGYIAQIALDHPGKPAIDPDKPAIGRHIPFDFTKFDNPEGTKEGVKGNLGEIVSKAEEAAQELEVQLRVTTDWFRSQDEKSVAMPGLKPL